MSLLIVSYLGGVLTILSPCILPVLPFVFARSDQPFVRTGLPLLFGMAVTFAAVATLAAVGGGWAVEANQYGRIAALALLVLFAATLVSRTLADRLTRPLVALGARLSQSARTTGGRAGQLSSFLLGVASGLLWAPCAGPILGLLLSSAALGGASVQTSLLFLAYAAGAATSLAVALFAGQRVFASLKRYLQAGEWIRRGLGAAVLTAVVAIVAGSDTALLSQVTFVSMTSFEQMLIDKIGARSDQKAIPVPTIERPVGSSRVNQSSDVERRAGVVPDRRDQALPITTAFEQRPINPDGPAVTTRLAATVRADLPVEGVFPGFANAVEWLNFRPLTAQDLRGKVVLVNFWTFGCFNCLHALPYVRAWAQKYENHGLIVIGVHSPEFAFEKAIDNVRQAMSRLRIDYPVVIDNNFAVWNAFGNRYWPANYFVDARGRIRYHHFGEHDYENSERVIQQLLEEAGDPNVPGGFVTTNATGVDGQPLNAPGSGKSGLAEVPLSFTTEASSSHTQENQGSPWQEVRHD